jgi:hypothetical protein
MIIDYKNQLIYSENQKNHKIHHNYQNMINELNDIWGSYYYGNTTLSGYTYRNFSNNNLHKYFDNFTYNEIWEN